jgi:N-hydroxyarylamine O-acetyltransferase
MFDWDAYLHRLDLPEAGAPSEATLARLHEAHALAIPFENLDIQMGRGIRLELPHLEAKLVRAARGGYCFEQNTLFRAALESAGFQVAAFEARVRVGTDRVLPRTHMLLQVETEGRAWLCDVGFGGGGPLRPVPMDGTPQPMGPWTFRVWPEGPLRVLQSLRGEQWADLYAFLPEPRPEVDFEMGNWFTSTHPDSRFMVTLTAQRTFRDRRAVLRNLLLEIESRDGLQTQEVPRSDLTRILREIFGIIVPDQARFRALDGESSPGM